MADDTSSFASSVRDFDAVFAQVRERGDLARTSSETFSFNPHSIGVTSSTELAASPRIGCMAGTGNNNFNVTQPEGFNHVINDHITSNGPFTTSGSARLPFPVNVSSSTSNFVAPKIESTMFLPNSGLPVSIFSESRMQTPSNSIPAGLGGHAHTTSRFTSRWSHLAPEMTSVPQQLLGEQKFSNLHRPPQVQPTHQFSTITQRHVTPAALNGQSDSSYRLPGYFPQHDVISTSLRNSLVGQAHVAITTRDSQSDSTSPVSRDLTMPLGDVISTTSRSVQEERKARNREAAMKCRAKKLEHIRRLERRVTDLRSTNVDLEKQIFCLRQEVQQLHMICYHHRNNGCLM